MTDRDIDEIDYDIDETDEADYSETNNEALSELREKAQAFKLPPQAGGCLISDGCGIYAWARTALGAVDNLERDADMTMNLDGLSIEPATAALLDCFDERREEPSAFGVFIDGVVISCTLAESDD